MNPKVDAFFDRATKWQEEFKALRKIVLETGLEEDLKWGHPCYTFNGANVVLIHGFKEYCAFLFFKGSLLKDPQKMLVRQTEKVQANRQIRFTRVSDIKKNKSVLLSYIYQAIEVEKAGLKIEWKKTSDYEIPEEFQKRMDKSTKLKKAFEGLTPGRQREYLYHFSSAKQSKTREARIDKYLPKILGGKGMDD